MFPNLFQINAQNLYINVELDVLPQGKDVIIMWTVMKNSLRGRDSICAPMK